LADTTAGYPSIKLCIIAPPGPERMELAVAAAGLHPLTTVPCQQASLKLAVRLIKEVEARGHEKPVPALFLDDAHLLRHHLQRKASTLHCKLIVGTTHEKYPFLSSELRYRTSGHTINLPPLHERQEDVAPVALSLLSGLPADYTVKGISQEAWDVLLAVKWPDTRGLLHAIQDAVVGAQLDGADQISLRHLPPMLLAASPHGFLDVPFSRGWTKKQLEETYILHCIARTNKKTHAARVLGMSKEGLYARLSRLTGKGKRRKMVEGEYVPIPPDPMPVHPGESWDRCGEGEGNPLRGIPRDFGGRPPAGSQRHRQEAAAAAMLKHEAACARKGVPATSRLFTTDYEEESE
jgi:hypothetical protein